jgi:drug/metabolite transporter (DMT)-like permease
MSLTPRVALMLAVPPLMWAANAVVGRIAIASIGALWLNAARWALALLLILPLGWRALAGAPARDAIRRRWPHLALLGLTGVGTYNALQYLALTTSTPLNVTLIASSAPVWAMAVGALGYGEHPRGRQLLGAALSLAGVAVVLSRGALGTLAQVRLVPGDLLMLIAVISWSIYSWMLARPPAHMAGAERPSWDWAEFLTVQIVVGLGWATLGAAVGEFVIPPPPLRWSAGLALALLFIAIGPSIVAYRLWGLGVAAAGPAPAAFMSNLTPLFAALLSGALLGEWPHAFHLLAFALIVGGIVVSSRPVRAVEPP